MLQLRLSLLISLLIATSVWANPPITGDFDGNGNLDCADIDMLVEEIAVGTNNPQFDLTGDGVVNLDDRDAWLAEAGATNISCQEPYVLGDVNLDENVDAADVVIVNANMGQSGAGWCGGDVNANGVVDAEDLSILMQFQGSSACAPLPIEPSNWGDIKTRFEQ
jgi:hypothetical protein